MEDIIQDIVTTSKIYIEVDDKSRIIKVFSSVFEEPKETSILIDEGHGDKFAHAHLYFEKPIYDMGYTYKYVDGQVVERTEEEIKEDLVVVEQQPTELQIAQEKIKKLEEELLNTNMYLTEVEIACLDNEAKANSLENELQVTNQYMTDLELLMYENILK